MLDFLMHIEQWLPTLLDQYAYLDTMPFYV